MTNLQRVAHFACSAILSGSAAGCFSPLATHHAVLEYDRTVSYVEADLMLLNIARARNHRPVHFTAISSVAATFDFRTNGSVGGSFGGVVFPTVRPFGLEYGMSVGENPTVTIIPITGEEFTKRILRPFADDKLQFLVHQGYDFSMLLRLMARGIETRDGQGTKLWINRPSEGDGFAEFRRRLLHLAGLEIERHLYIEPILYEETQTLNMDRSLNPDEVLHSIEKGIHWELDLEKKTYTVRRNMQGRLLIANYDPTRLPNEERVRLQKEALRYPLNQVLIDIRPGFPGGDYPLHGTLVLRSMNSMIGFIARAIEEEPETQISPDPRTKTVGRNPAKTLEVEESPSKPKDYEFSVKFNDRYYSIHKYDNGNMASWNQEAFAILTNLFQMTVSDLSKYPSPSITIAK